MAAARLDGARALALVSLAVAALGFERSATAQPLPEHPSSSLQWVRLAGADKCIGSQALARAVEGRLGRSVFVPPTQADLTVEGHVQGDPHGFEATISVARRDGSIVGRRELSVEGDSCQKLDEGLIVVIALLIDPAGEASTAQPTATPTPAQPVTATWAPTLHAGVGVAAGPAPRVAPLLDLGAGLHASSGWSFEASFLGTLPTSREDSVTSGQFRWYAGELSLCRRLTRPAALELGICGGALAGVVSAEAQELQLSTPRSKLYGSVGAHGFAAWHAAGPFWVEAEAGLSGAWYRPTFQYQHLDRASLTLTETELWQSQLWGVRAALRARLSF